MKKIIASVAVALFAIVSLQTQAQTAAKETTKEQRAEKKTERKALRKLDGNQVSQRAKEAFLVDFGNIPGATWVRGAQFDEVTFVQKGTKKTAYYDYDSKLVGTTIAKKFADIPANAQKSIQKDYKTKGYTVGAVVMYDDNENNDSDMLMFGTQFEDADHYFVTITKDGHEEVLMVSLGGEVSYFKKVS